MLSFFDPEMGAETSPDLIGSTCEGDDHAIQLGARTLAGMFADKAAPEAQLGLSIRRDTVIIARFHLTMGTTISSGDLTRRDPDKT
jgi:hypothetical protein